MPPADLLKTVTLAVLAGGTGSRMGRPKSLLEIRGKPILDHLLDQLAWPGPTLLVTAPGCENPPGAGRFDCEASDAVAGEGPLRGVLTALDHATTEMIAVIAVDAPAVRGEDVAWYVERLAETQEAVGVMASSRAGTIEPLPCALRAGARDVATTHLAAGQRSLRGLADDARIHVLDGSGRSERAWLNANTPQEWERIVRGLDD